MVSTVHEALRDLVRDDPNLCIELLAQLNVIDRATIDEATCVDLNRHSFDRRTFID